jgi:hypothetical protein
MMHLKQYLAMHFRQYTSEQVCCDAVAVVVRALMYRRMS